MKTREVITRHGVLSVPVIDPVMGRSLIQLGEWAMDEILVAQRFVRPGSVVIDCGAFIGSHTIEFARMTGPAGRVFAFEPQQDIYNLLCFNLNLNVKNTTAFQLALSDTEKEVTLYKMPNENPIYGCTALLHRAGGFTEEEKATAKTLDSFNFTDVSFIKMDVEFHELEVLRGAAETIKRERPVIMLEAAPAHDMHEIREWLNQSDYVHTVFNSNYFREDNFNKCVTNPFPDSMHQPMWLCVPKERSEELNG